MIRTLLYMQLSQHSLQQSMQYSHLSDGVPHSPKQCQSNWGRSHRLTAYTITRGLQRETHWKPSQPWFDTDYTSYSPSERANGRKKQKTNKTKFRMSMQNGADYWKPPPCNKGHIMMGTRVSVISSHQRPLSHQKKNQGLLWENDSSREEHSSNLIPFLNPGQYHSNTRGCCVDKGSILER